jgi:predicted nucleic acid-binding protein
MKILIDTNIILDVLLNRQPFVNTSVKIFEHAEKGKIEAFITANAVTDIVYLLRKAYSMDEIKKNLLIMFDFIKIMSVTSSEIINALRQGAPDFEDAVAMQCAKQGGLDLIVTRNKKDFEDSPVKCVTVEEWLGSTR